MVRRIGSLAGLLVALFVVGSSLADDYRLPQGAYPTSQRIELRLDPAKPGYSGEVRIELTVDRDIARFGIHEVGLDLHNIELSRGGQSRQLEAADGDYEITWLSDGDTIAAGAYTLRITFAGDYSTDSLGMHRVEFEGNSYVFTQFQTMYARTAMPLFDEPGFKIPYQLTINAPEDLSVVANTPVASHSVSGGWQRVEFEATRPLPSYLLAYAVGPLDRAPIRGMSAPGFIYTPKGHAGETGFIARETPKIVRALEEYFGFDYPYRKLDFIAVPEYAHGAMENPGLITYRTDLLLLGDEAIGAAAERALYVVAHEVSHIWYGDYVTMQWWNDLWLNEAFATWMGTMVIDQVYPQYETTLKLPQIGAFAADQLPTSAAIRRTVRTKEEVASDLELNYSKGSAILQMLEAKVGSEQWRDGVRRYLEQHAWANAEASDLWSAISETSGLDVGRIADGYLNQPGFALVTLTANGKVNQERYLPLGLDAEGLEWEVPLNIKYKHRGNTYQTELLLDDKAASVDVPDNAEWVFPDVGGNGYYRWHIGRDRFYALIEDLDELTGREKIAVLDNSEALLGSGHLSLADYLFVLDRLISDEHPTVFLLALEKLKLIGEDYNDATSAALFARFVDDKLVGRYTKVGSHVRPGDSEALIQMRPRLIRVLGQFGSHQPVFEAAERITESYLEDPGDTDTRLARAALRVTALSDDGSRYEDYIDAYLKSESEKQKSTIIVSFYFRNPDIVRKHLDFSVSPAVPAGDALSAFILYSIILDDAAVIYDWLRTNLDTLEAKIPGIYRERLPEILNGACNEANLSHMKTFFAPHGKKYEVSLAKAMEGMRACIDRKQRQRAPLMEFLAQYQ